jgi:ABC-type multidrug transport system ATPase subunit
VTISGFILTVLETVGLWGIFRKCGQTPWKSLIPFYKDYALAECAGRQPEGVHVFVLEILMAAISILVTVLKDGSTAQLVLVFVTLAVSLDLLIIQVKIWLGLVEVYDRRKRWIILFILPYINVLVTCLYGWGRRFQPQWKLEDFRENEANFFSGVLAQALDNGLTVNINERSARNLFEKKYLLRDIHMYIKPGSMVLLLGGSGAGKTTFVNAVVGYEKADAEIMLNGNNVYKEYKKMKYEIGFVPQQDLMRGNDTVLRTLTDAAALRLPVDFDAGERRERVDEVMKIFGLEPISGSLVDKLSGGQRKRLSIAMEFISNPTLFILDEPDSGLDGVMARELMQQLRRIADQGKIVVVITHTPDRVIDLFDDVIVLAKDAARTGRLAYFGSVEEARSFFGRERMEQIVMSVNRPEEGGDGMADEYIRRYAQAQGA